MKTFEQFIREALLKPSQPKPGQPPLRKPTSPESKNTLKRKLDKLGQIYDKR